MTEKALHYIWEHQLFSHIDFYKQLYPKIPIEGEILQVGTPNCDGGPDFLNAKICLGKLILAGNVEIHLKASDWIIHRHQEDPAYDNVVLHVVLEADQDIYHRTTGEPLSVAVVVCSQKILEEAETNFLKRREAKEDALCPIFPPSTDRSSLPKNKENPLSPFIQDATTLYLERLKEKAKEIESLVDENRGDLSESLHQMLLRYLGGKVNNEAFSLLGKYLPLRVIRKHTDNLEILEALYLGQAALLSREVKDDYMLHLRERYQFLATKYQLSPLAEGCVRMLRLHPPAFPQRRLAIMSSMRYHFPLLESLFMSCKELKDLHQKLAILPSDYWQHHYTFAVPSSALLKGLSKESINLLILNVVIPFRYLLYTKRDDLKGVNSLIQWASAIPSESNHYTRTLKEKGYPLHSALESQAYLYQLKKNSK